MWCIVAPIISETSTPTRGLSSIALGELIELKIEYCMFSTCDYYKCNTLIYYVTLTILMLIVTLPLDMGSFVYYNGT